MGPDRVSRRYALHPRTGMPPPSSARVFARPISLAAVVALCVAGCAGTRAPRPASTDTRPGSVATASDTERLAALAAARKREKALGGYRIGPDDLLEIRIPDLLDMPSATSGTASRPGDAAPTAVSGAPTFAQGVRVSA